ncbi:hypothetical protein BRW62_12255 [Parathermosynechococcus lividus PCC 6715]|uniref:DUF3370 domain-containing protein n=1 Tax=Parathermosynechococcus lividus PCC 6715 TaxID=1917166 RepID=A0A2D2Q548_PARLV|nr:DUF3370 domain-containing protein [Thermostichus lividus]ATS19651.1 hypothetical protein BRW62_12255 [Thermostichus lividus PCC 6715]
MLAPILLAQAALPTPPQQVPVVVQEHSVQSSIIVQANAAPVGAQAPRVSTPPTPAATAYVTPTNFAYFPQDIRPLPGHLDNIPVFNSNSPEMVRSEGILLSTFPPQGKWQPAAHLNYPIQGRFDVFAHHITQSNRAVSTPTIYLGLLAYNPSDRPVTVTFYQAASFLSTPDAPFRSLPAIVDNPIGYVFSGPGSRVTNQVLRGVRQTFFPSQVVIPAREARMLSNLPLPLPTQFPNAVINRARAEFMINQDGTVGPMMPLITDVSPFGEVSSSNGRSTLMHLQSNGPIYLAKMSMFARMSEHGTERAPTLEEWWTMLHRGQLVTPRDIPPTPPNSTSPRFFYGRVAGISRGSQWKASLTDEHGQGTALTIPAPGRAISYGISTLHRGTLGTGQIQSAPMLARYPDTAYYAHGNYGVHYSLTLPLLNDSRSFQSVVVTLQTPLKQDHRTVSLQFLEPPAPQVFFRGTVRVRFTDDVGQPQERYVHLVQRRGQRGEPLVTLNMRPGEKRNVSVDLLYPPDATPPQVLTVATLLGPSYQNTTHAPVTDSLSLTPVSAP